MIFGTSGVRPRAASGGGIQAVHIDGSLDAGTSGGSVEIQTISGDLHAHSSGGPIRITEAGGKIDADTSGGGIHASFARGNSKGGRLESSGGGITVSVDPAANLSIDAEGDSVDTDLPLQIHGSASHGSLHGRLNSGGSPLRLKTSRGIRQNPGALARGGTGYALRLRASAANVLPRVSRERPPDGGLRAGQTAGRAAVRAARTYNRPKSPDEPPGAPEKTTGTVQSYEKGKSLVLTTPDGSRSFDLAHASVSGDTDFEIGDQVTVIKIVRSNGQVILAIAKAVPRK